MQSPPRRQFLKQASLLSLAPFPSLFSSLVAGERRFSERILVVIQLSGGNDGINTIIPVADEGYAKNRKELKIDANRLIRVDDSHAMHPSLRGAADLLDDRRLAIVQGVGYPNPNRSHEVSMAIWQSARMDRLDHTSYGWLGRAMDDSLRDLGGTPSMVLLGDENPPLAIRGRRSTSVAMADLDDLKLHTPFPIPADGEQDSDSLIEFARRTTFDAVHTAQRIDSSVAQSSAPDSGYPATQLSGRLRSIAKLIKSGFSTPVYYAMQGGYDTHSAQLPTHARLLRELGDGLKAFQDDLRTAGIDDRVVTMCFSEFGRRVAENASLGTDHGTAGPVLVAGSAIQAGLIGNPPSLSDLEDGDLKMQIDFRQVYVTLLRDWLGIDPRPSLNGEFESLPIFA